MADPTDPKKTVRKSTAKKPTARPGARKPAARRSPASKPPIPEPPIDEPVDDEALGAPASDAYRPVAVMGSASVIPTSDELERLVPDDAVERATDVAGEPLAPAIDEIEHPMRELGVGVLAALLAALTFVPWYRAGTLEASGWSSGTWGPVVFGIGLAGALIVLLRRLRVPLTLPVHHAVVLEISGWAAVGLLLLKRFMPPSIGAQKMDDTSWLLGSIIVALGLALAGGSVSQAVSMVIRPGWFASRAGKLGTAVLGGSLLLGAVFGFLNDVSNGLPSTSGAPPTQFTPGYPDCAKNVGIPIPEGIEAVDGVPASTGFCYARLQSDLGSPKIMRLYATVLKTNAWRILYDSRKATAVSQGTQGQLQARKDADCVSVTISKKPQGTGSQVILLVGPPNTLCRLQEGIEQQQGGTGD